MATPCLDHSHLWFDRTSVDAGGSYKSLRPHELVFSFHLTPSENTMFDEKWNRLWATLRFSCLIIAATLIYYMTLSRSSNPLVSLRRRELSVTDEILNKITNSSSKFRPVPRAKLYRVCYRFHSLHTSNIATLFSYLKNNGTRLTCYRCHPVSTFRTAKPTNSASCAHSRAF